MERVKWLLSIVGGALTVFARQYALILIFTTIGIVIDIVTGIIKAQVTGEGISSKKGTRGFWKKVALLVALFFGFFLDYFIPFALATMNISIPVSSAFFGMTIGCYIVLNEAISTTENLYIINPDIFPKWIVTILRTAKKRIGDSNKEIKELIEEKEEESKYE